MKRGISSFSRRRKAGIGVLLAICVLSGGWFLYRLADEIIGHDVPLYTAAQAGDWKQVQADLARGADPNETTDLQNDRTALFWAAFDGRADMVQLLLRKGIDVNKVDTHGQTALDYAGDARRGKPSEVVHCLKQAGAKRGAEL